MWNTRNSINFRYILLLGPGETQLKESLMKYRFAEMIWYETKEAAEAERVAVLPVATYEDHGFATTVHFVHDHG